MGIIEWKEGDSFGWLGRAMQTHEVGCVNVKSARDMNCAMLAKLAWRVMTYSGRLLCEVLGSKYGLNEDDGVHFRDRQRCSQIWKGAIWGAEMVREGLKWDVRNGKGVVFWKDIWLGQRPLWESTLSSMDEDRMVFKVDQFWEQGVGWRWRTLG